MLKTHSFDNPAVLLIVDLKNHIMHIFVDFSGGHIFSTPLTRITLDVFSDPFKNGPPFLTVAIEVKESLYTFSILELISVRFKPSSTKNFIAALQTALTIFCK